MRRHFNITVGISLLMLAWASLQTSCLLFRKSSKSGGEVHPLIKPESILFDRLPSGDRARLSFQTREPVHCQLSWWNQDPVKSPTKERPLRKDCSNKAAQRFLEVITDLSTEELYIVRIEVWKDNKANIEDAIDVSERHLDGLGPRLMVMRVNLPLSSAEIHQFEPGHSLSMSELNEILSNKNECRSGFIDPSFPLSTDAKRLDYARIETQGFATAGANKSSGASIMKLRFNGYFFNEPWIIRFGTPPQLKQMSVSSPAVILSAELADSSSRAFFNEPYLARARTIMPLTNAQSLQLRVRADSLNMRSFYLMQVGQGEQEGRFHCFFSGAAEGWKIPVNFLNVLKKNERYEVTLSLISHQLRVFPDGSDMSWLVTSHDWKVIAIERRF